MHAIIKTACNALKTEGFEGFYETLIEDLIPNLKTTYVEFINRTNRATLPLTSQKDALFYSMAYDKGHHLTFTKVLQDNIVFDESDDIINIIDYGCGQGNATLATLAHIAKFRDPQTTHLNIHLIEPSKISLGNAKYKIEVFAKALGFSANITKQNVMLADAELPDFANDNDTLHLMSYILDIDDVQDELSIVTDQIKELPGKNFVIASGVNRHCGKYGFQLLSRLLTGKTQYIKSYNLPHQRYDIFEGEYSSHTAKAVGMMVEVHNTYSQKLAA